MVPRDGRGDFGLNRPQRENAQIQKCSSAAAAADQDVNCT
jgi:hypothetical protein